jgi:hypothetical protein
MKGGIVTQEKKENNGIISGYFQLIQRRREDSRSEDLYSTTAVTV